MIKPKNIILISSNREEKITFYDELRKEIMYSYTMIDLIVDTFSKMFPEIRIADYNLDNDKFISFMKNYLHNLYNNNSQSVIDMRFILPEVVNKFVNRDETDVIYLNYFNSSVKEYGFISLDTTSNFHEILKLLKGE